MFTTIDEVEKYTGKTVTNDLIFMAQSLIEAYVGRPEAFVDDQNDKANLAKATAYQAVYMQDNADTVFNQIDAATVASFGSTITFRNDGASPFIAKPAVMACRNLSWRGSRSVAVGKMLDRGGRRYDWRVDD